MVVIAGESEAANLQRDEIIKRFKCVVMRWKTRILSSVISR